MLFAGCSQEPIASTSPVAAGEKPNISVQPPSPVAIVETPTTAKPKPAKPTLRPKFRDGLEAFVTEAGVYLRLPETGASVQNMLEQHDKMQQAFLRTPTPDGVIEGKVYEEAKTLTSESRYIVEFLRIYMRSRELPNANDLKAKIDGMLKEYKLKLKAIEQVIED